MNALSGSTLVFLLLVVLLAPRRWAVLAMMAGVFFLTQGHSVALAGLNVYPLRFLELAAFTRVLLRRELVVTTLGRIDIALLLAYNYAALVWVLHSSHAAAEQFGAAVDPTLCYLSFRALITGVDDVRWFLRAFVFLLLPFTGLVLLERVTGQSAFTLVGATPQLIFRDEAARCEGSFRHAILLGSVAASFVPLYLGLFLAGPRRALSSVGGVLCVALVVLSNSGGPLTSLTAAIIGWFAWPMRTRMRLIRRTVLAIVIILAFVMKAPIWYLPYKISSIVGGGGYHRGLLMEQAWLHLNEWWLAGMDIRDTASWIPYVHDLFGGADITNQFLTFGLRAGLPALALFVTLLVFAFQALGSAIATVRVAGNTNRREEFFLWGLGVALIVHVVSWLGVAYFDQSWAVWLMHLAAVSASTAALSVPALQRSASSRGSAVHPVPKTAYARVSHGPVVARSIGWKRSENIRRY